MPVMKCPNGKWKIGTGQCMFHSKELAVKAYQAYLSDPANRSAEAELGLSIAEAQQLLEASKKNKKMC